jgi:hypothetical protein
MIYHPPGAWTADDDYRLNQIIRLANPPRVTAPVLLRSDDGVSLGEHARAGAAVPAVQVWHKNRRKP